MLFLDTTNTYLVNYMKKCFIFLLNYCILIIGDIMTYEYIIIFIVILIILLAILKINKKNVKLDMNKLVEYLGGKDNILDSEVNLSRFIVTLEDISKVNKDAIVDLGAKGIVELDNQLKIILGPDSKQLKKYIDEIK